MAPSIDDVKANWHEFELDFPWWFSLCPSITKKSFLHFIDLKCCFWGKSRLLTQTMVSGCGLEVPNEHTNLLDVISNNMVCWGTQHSGVTILCNTFFVALSDQATGHTTAKTWLMVTVLTPLQSVDELALHVFLHFACWLSFVCKQFALQKLTHRWNAHKTIAESFWPRVVSALNFTAWCTNFAFLCVPCLTRGWGPASPGCDLRSSHKWLSIDFGLLLLADCLKTTRIYVSFLGDVLSQIVFDMLVSTPLLSLLAIWRVALASFCHLHQFMCSEKSENTAELRFMS